ncbi:MAG: hypothetical protein M3137_18795 [Actinomycetota bacterium]|nr:hypothetical protein [Actinomycetota bacterium]
MIDMERLDADLDLALVDELRVQVTPPTVVRGPLAAEAVAPQPGPAPSGGAALRPRPSPRPSSPRPSSPLAPADPVWDDFDIEAHARAVVDLVALGKLAEADLHIVAHAELAHASGRPDHRGDASGWAVMRALLDGRALAARAGIDEPAARERTWVQRFALALAWGDEHERYDVLDHCRERAYCQGDIAWQGRLTLLLAVLGRNSEATRELDTTIDAVLRASTCDAGWLDLATDLAEAAAILGDPDRCHLAGRGLDRAKTPIAVAGPAWVCKGSVARYQALVTAAAGEAEPSDRYFHSAAEIHRRLGAEVLLARTLGEWGRSLAGRDPSRGARLTRESSELSHQLGLSPGAPAIDALAARAS